MNSRDAIAKALTPGDMFNQKGHVWRSLQTLAQFAGLEGAELLDVLDEHFQGLVTVRPNRGHPEHGPLIALNAHVPPAAEDPQVVVTGGNAVVPEAERVEAIGIAMNPDVQALERLDEEPPVAVLLDPQGVVNIEIEADAGQAFLAQATAEVLEDAAQNAEALNEVEPGGEDDHSEF